MTEASNSCITMRVSELLMNCLKCLSVVEFNSLMIIAKIRDSPKGAFW